MSSLSASKPCRPLSAVGRRRSLPARLPEPRSCPTSPCKDSSSKQNKLEVSCCSAGELSQRISEAQEEMWHEGQLRRQAAEATQRKRRNSIGEPWKTGGACAGTVRTACLSRTHGSTTSGLFSDCQPLTAHEHELAQKSKEQSRDVAEEGKQRRKAAEAAQAKQRHSLTGEPWRNGGACAGTVRTASLSRTNGSTTSGLFSDTKYLEALDLVEAKDRKESSKETQEEGRMRREAAEATQRKRRNSIGEPWRTGGACAGTVRTAGLSRTHGSTTSGLFSECKPLEACEYTSTKTSKELSFESQNDGRLRREAAEATQRKRRNSVGEAWRTSGACAGAVRTASLSRTHGSTTSGLFSECESLEAHEHVLAKKGQGGLESQDEGRLRRQEAEAAQRQRRNSMGEPWRSGGACAGTVRTANLSRTHGSTTSGLFSQTLLLEGSDCAGIVSQAHSDKDDSAGIVSQAHSNKDARKQKGSGSVSAEPWRYGGACAGTIRAPGLSRTHGSTVSGLFSDVQPLAGSESLACLREKQRRRRSFCRRPDTTSIEASMSLSRSTSQPSLSRTSASVTTSTCEEPLSNDSVEETPAESRTLSEQEAEEPVADRTSPTSEASVEMSTLEKPCAGSAFATVRAARCGGA